MKDLCLRKNDDTTKLTDDKSRLGPNTVKFVLSDWSMETRKKNQTKLTLT